MLNALPLRKPGPTGSPFFRVPASPQDLPVFRALKSCESAIVLARNNVGRIAFSVDGRVQMLPVHFQCINGWIYGRTAAPAFLPANAAVAFEVEESTASGEWRNVVVQGRLDLVEAFNAGSGRSLYQRAWSLVRGLVQSGQSESPSALFRDQLFGIRVREISGRASLPAGGRRLSFDGGYDRSA